MSADKKAKAKTEQAKGKAKEALGRMTGNERLTAEGRIDQVKGETREEKEKANEAFRR
ncbi:CsbD family protein [Streptomyces sp. NBC_00083]|uniref:CsbD family protein n=1 Tax=unclassified Streptomyces TaxID=2593676 RepID=UPI0022568444|nr:CsbD family protein [Streptomyces sp. NBC_00083]MCX5387196.1 CsbD family protein [Streptomyces sp. NBC_00083]